MKRVSIPHITLQIIPFHAFEASGCDEKVNAFVSSIPSWLLPRLGDRPSIKKRRSHLLVKFLLILVLILVLMGWWTVPVALAETQFLKEAGQWIYQAHHTLIDFDAQTWDVTVIKPMEVGRQGVFLHVKTEAPSVHLDASAPLVLVTDSGQKLMADNVTQHYFIGAIPDPTVGQYAIQPVLPGLRGERQIQLQLPTQGDEAIAIAIDPDVLNEWLAVGTCQYLMCYLPSEPA